MTISRAKRREERRPLVAESVSTALVEVVLDLLEIFDLAWHDCYGDRFPPEHVVHDVLLVGGGDLGELIKAVRLGVTDWRDLRVVADAVRPEQ